MNTEVSLFKTIHNYLCEEVLKKIFLQVDMCLLFEVCTMLRVWCDSPMCLIKWGKPAHPWHFHVSVCHSVDFGARGFKI